MSDTVQPAAAAPVARVSPITYDDTNPRINHVTSFWAYCRGGKVGGRGEFYLNMAVPPENMLNALPVTQAMHVQFLVDVWGPEGLSVARAVFVEPTPDDLAAMNVPHERHAPHDAGAHGNGR